MSAPLWASHTGLHDRIDLPVNLFLQFIAPPWCCGLFTGSAEEDLGQVSTETVVSTAVPVPGSIRAPLAVKDYLSWYTQAMLYLRVKCIINFSTFEYQLSDDWVEFRIRLLAEPYVFSHFMYLDICSFFVLLFCVLPYFSAQTSLILSWGWAFLINETVAIYQGPLMC